MRQIGDPNGIAASLEGVAMAASSKDSRGRDFRLCGAAATLREKIGKPMHLDERLEYDARLTDARSALGDFTFNSA